MFNFSASCILCNAFTKSKTSICLDCAADLPRISNPCHICAYDLKPKQKCPDCTRLKFSFERVFAPFSYVFPVNELIKQFKQQGKWHYGKALTWYLGEFVQQEWIKENLRPDALIPIPSTSSSMLERGFNQTQIMSKILRQNLKIPLLKNALVSNQKTPQKALNALERNQNLTNAFILSTKDNWQDLHIAIVDDVVTTGATANTAAMLLKKAGVKRVDIYCLARTVFT